MSAANESGDMAASEILVKSGGTDALSCILQRINSIHEDLKKDISDLRAENKEINKTLNNFKDEIKLNITTVTNDLSKLKNKMIAANQENLYLKECINNLQATLNENTQVLKFNKIKITNVPTNINLDILTVVKKISLVIRYELLENSLEECYRIKALNSNNSPIIFKFVKNCDKLQFLDCYRKYIRNSTLTLNSVLNASDDANLNTQLYISEHMSPQTYKLFKQAKNLKNVGKAKFVWFRNNKILVRKVEGVPAAVIRSELDIQHLFGQFAATPLSDETEIDGPETDKSDSSRSGATRKRKTKKSPTGSIKPFLKKK
ncbi:uncharacterized protein [Rhodnius prolixus]|uniref:uncharacterized protein n=1 Tax=Rhodnius prolixus TaxID=13249 RepID=UPI003D18F7C8